MMLIKQNIEYDFMGKRRLTMMLSASLIVISIFSLAIQGLNLGVDFTGGTLVEVGYDDAVELDSVRNILDSSEFAGTKAQYFGSVNDVLLRVRPLEDQNMAEISESILQLLQADGQSLQMRRIEYVGPQIGEELTDAGGLAMLYALLGILFYVALRFQMRFSLGSIAALLHDVLITVGIFSLTQMNFDLTVLAALLAVVGYSLNDTIVIFDRIRENLRKSKTAEPLQVINRSLNQTFNRTIITSLTTLLVLFALLFLGGEIIRGFAAALIIGVLVGTYSSIFIASPVLLALGVTRNDLLVVAKEEEEKIS